MNKGLKILSVASTIVMLFVLIGGALVTKTGSGMGCGRSWPLCHGKFLPTEITQELIIELSHRLFSGLSVILVTWLAIWSWRKIGHIRETKFLAFLSVFFLVVQALLGAGAVIWGQDPVIMALHFGVSLVSVAAVFLLMLLIFEVDKKFDAESLILDKGLRKQIYALSIYSYVVVYTGALVRHKKAHLACLDFPFCDNDAIFSLPGNQYQWVQMAHRFAALIIFLWIVYLSIRMIKQYRTKRVIFWSAISITTLITLQGLSGALIIFTKVDLYVALAHATFITILFCVLCYLVLLSTRSKKNEQINKKIA
ncbi:COX15/CtaA family protein [Calidifontibacillus erzurumensis]|uniref:Heme A synthase n=1 Tax=Calidifontibacillus erzurumensis TaxID=2741433 RepID=A0A8J8KDJ2_9BACI|nr:heme A synthase [Calidifontibacillus erzurumensis]NSL50740.1 heme A synthase [Calidifontibacillus erzurumensis]